MKRIITSLLCVALLFVSAIPSAFAVESASVQKFSTQLSAEELTHLSLNESKVLNDGAVVTRISRYNYETSDESNSCNAQSKSLLNQLTLRSNGGGEYYYDYVRTYYLNNRSDCPFKADLHAKLKLFAVGGYAEIEDVKTVYSCLSPGSATATYHCEGSGYDINDAKKKFPCGNITLWSDGEFTVNTSVSSGVSVTVLESLGFSQNVTNNYIWTSKVMNMYGNYKTYQS